MNIVPGRIELLLEKRNKSKVNLARHLNFSDVAVYKIISRGSTRFETVEKIAKFFDVPVEYLHDEKLNLRDYLQNNTAKPNVVSDRQEPYKPTLLYNADEYNKALAAYDYRDELIEMQKDMIDMLKRRVAELEKQLNLAI